MKSFSFKAIALAFVVVAGSAQAGFVDSVKGLPGKVANGVKSAVQATDTKLFGGHVTTFEKPFPFKDVPKTRFVKGLPVFSKLNGHNGYVRAAVVVAAGAAISAAAYKTYRYFRPAAQATEGENVEANTEVVA